MRRRSVSDDTHPTPPQASAGEASGAAAAGQVGFRWTGPVLVALIGAFIAIRAVAAAAGRRPVARAPDY